MQVALAIIHPHSEPCLPSARPHLQHHNGCMHNRWPQPFPAYLQSLRRIPRDTVQAPGLGPWTPCLALQGGRTCSPALCSHLPPHSHPQAMLIRPAPLGVQMRPPPALAGTRAFVCPCSFTQPECRCPMTGSQEPPASKEAQMTLTGLQQALLQSLARWDPQPAGRLMPPLLHHCPCRPMLDSSRRCIANSISLRKELRHQSWLLPILMMLLLLLEVGCKLPSAWAD